MRERGVALAFLLASGIYLALALSFPLGTGARPGAGFFPVAVGSFLCVVAGALVVVAWQRQGATAAPATAATRVERSARGRVAAAMVGLIGFCVLLPWLGYAVTAFLFVALLLRTLGTNRWTIIVLAAVVSAAASYYLFAVLLAVPLPRGDLLGF
jgi:putative tricarboxylic transport membrane protein